MLKSVQKMQFFPSFCSFCLKTGSFCCKKLHFYFKRINQDVKERY